MNEKILIAVPSGSGLVTTDFMQNYTNIVTTLIRFKYQVGEAVIKRALIDNARNEFIKMARNEDVDYILFLDDDTLIDPMGIIKMIVEDKDIISPPVADRKGGDYLNIYNLNNERINEIKETQKVGGIGMACTLIKRKVIDAMLKKYDKPFEFQIARNLNNKAIYLSEDISFCYRASTLGFETWAIKGIETKHIGEPNFYTYAG